MAKYHGRSYCSKCNTEVRISHFAQQLGSPILWAQAEVFHELLVQNFLGRYGQDERSQRADREGGTSPVPAALEGVRRRQADWRHRLELAGSGAGAEPA